MRIDHDLARAEAEALLDQTVRLEVPDVEINNEATRETEPCWAFFYNTRANLETGSIRPALAGNAPIFAKKDDPSTFFGRTETPVEDQIP